MPDGRAVGFNFYDHGFEKLHRPFVGVAGICGRGDSRPLQRVITDFGADKAFGRVSEKLKEHYGITVPRGAAATGNALKRLALAAGLNRRTQVHGVGDGALWIAEQIETQFGAKGRYLIDFYHLCDYLAYVIQKRLKFPSAWWKSARQNRGVIRQTPKNSSRRALILQRPF
jgi:hypothetical protein